MAVVAEDWVSMSAPEAGASSSAGMVDAPANGATYRSRVVATVEERAALELDADVSTYVGAAANDATYDGRCRPGLCVVRGSILYEEYHRFGTSSYRAADSSIDVSPKRYRYIGKERDEETGLDHMGARYYAAWLGRWTAADPIGLGDGVNRYAYVRGNPVGLRDPGGTAAGEPQLGQNRSYEGPLSPFNEGSETMAESPSSGLAGSYRYGEVPQRPETHTETGGRIVTPDAPRTFRGPEALRQVREAVRDDLFIEATAQGLLGGKGRSFEYSAIIFREVTKSGEIEYSHTRPLPGDTGEVEFTRKELESRVEQTRRAQGKPPGHPEVFELAHAHPSGVRASFEHRPEALSKEDIETGRAGEAEGAVPSNLALVTPSGGYDVVGDDTGGRVVENILPRTKANRLGFRPDYRPDVPDLGEAVRARVKHIVGERRTELEHQLSGATGRVQRRLERRLNRLESREARALRRLERKMRRGRL